MAPTRKLSATTFIRRSPRRRSASAAVSAPANDSAKLGRSAAASGDARPPADVRSVCHSYIIRYNGVGAASDEP